MTEYLEVLTYVGIAFVVAMLIEDVAHPPRRSTRIRKWD